MVITIAVIVLLAPKFLDFKRHLKTKNIKKTPKKPQILRR